MFLVRQGFIIAKGVVPPELCKTCCDDLLSRGPQARRTSDILKYNSEAFNEVLVHTWDRLGPLMEAIMGPVSAQCTRCMHDAPARVSGCSHSGFVGVDLTSVVLSLVLGLRSAAS